MELRFQVLLFQYLIMKLLQEKQEMVEEAEKKVALIDTEYQQGLITLAEKKRLHNDVWLKVTDVVCKAHMEES